jgi:aminopeptidase N
MATKNENKIKYLKDYKAPDFAVDNINLTIELNEDSAIVTNNMQVTRINSDKKLPLILDGNNQELITVEIDGNNLDKSQYILTENNLTIPTYEKEKFAVTVISKNIPQNNTSLAGLYQSGDIFLTQCEPNGFSRITYFLDRPDIMTIYTTKLIADKKYPVLLSNGDQIDHGDLSNNKHFITWKDISKKPSYLFAAVAGNLKVRKDIFITKSGKKIELKIYVPENDLAKTKYAMESLKDAMKWDEDVFAREYDLNTYMIVGTPKFNFGAMENKGLNIFNNKVFLANKDIANDINHMDIHDVIGHEYFHNWTGNRITLRNWFQLSLKEGLTVFRDQEFGADRFDRSIKRIQDANFIRSIQFQEDTGALSHPIRPESYIEMDNFYTTTVYDKGAEVIRMIKTILGEKAFANSMQLYFERHDGQAVTTEDFVKAMEDGSGVDLSQFKLWYSQAGTPNIEVKDNYNEQDHSYTLSLRQYSDQQHANNKPFHIPIKLGLVSEKTGENLTSSYEGKVSAEHIIHLKNSEQKFIFNNVSEKPIPSLLRDFSAPVKIYYPYTDEQLLFLLANDENEFNKWDAGQKYFANLLLKFMADIQRNNNPKIPDNLISSIKSLLNNKNLDKAFIAEAISIPSEDNLYTVITEIDPEVIFTARRSLQQTIGNKLAADLLIIYNDLNSKLSQKEYSLSQTDIAARRLKNLCLQYLAIANKKLGDELAEKQLKNSDNITDRFIALIILANTENKILYKNTFENFYNQWKHEDLVIDKWFVAQALSERADVASVVKQLLNHPAFDIKTPNRIYSLVRAFSTNHNKFHALDGSGYILFTDFILEVDKINPSIAARLVKIFENYRKFEPKRRAMMIETLQKIQKQLGLSENTREIVDKILAQ